MFYYKEVPKFDEYTGKSIKPEWVKAGRVCDITGEIIEKPLYEILVDYSYDCEPVFDEDRDNIAALKPFDINYDEIFLSPFHFGSHDYDGLDESLDIMRKTRGDTIEEKFRKIRFNIVMKLLKKGWVKGSIVGS